MNKQDVQDLRHGLAAEITTALNQVDEALLRDLPDNARRDTQQAIKVMREGAIVSVEITLAQFEVPKHLD